MKPKSTGIEYFCPPNCSVQSHNLLDKQALQWYMQSGFEGGANGLPNSFSADSTQDDLRKSHPEGLISQLVSFAEDAYGAYEYLVQS